MNRFLNAFRCCRWTNKRGMYRREVDYLNSDLLSILIRTVNGAHRAYLPDASLSHTTLSPYEYDPKLTSRVRACTRVLPRKIVHRSSDFRYRRCRWRRNTTAERTRGDYFVRRRMTASPGREQWCGCTRARPADDIPHGAAIRFWKLADGATYRHRGETGTPMAVVFSGVHNSLFG